MFLWKRYGKLLARFIVCFFRKRACIVPISAQVTPFSRALFWRALPTGRVIGMRLSTLCTILSLLVLLAVSGPHLVHHATELPLHGEPHDSADHDHDQTAPQTPTSQRPTLPDCVVLFLVQHTPGAQSGCALSFALPTVAEPLPTRPPLEISAAPRPSVQTRAPPLAFL